MKDLLAQLALAGDAETEIFRTEDSFGPVVVLEYGGLRILSFDSPFEQSAMRVNAPLALMHKYTQAMLLLLLFKEPAHVTLLGLGGGSLLRTLHHHCEQTLFDVVELRKSVIDIALAHFSVPSDKRVVFHNRNGFVYLNETKKHSTDFILADMYQAKAMEPFQATTRFLEQCWQLLTPDGWLAINFHKLPPFDHPYMKKMCRLFPEVLCCATESGNYVVMCGKQSLTQPLSEYRSKLDTLEQRFDTRLTRHFSHIMKISTGTTGQIDAIRPTRKPTT